MVGGGRALLGKGPALAMCLRAGLEEAEDAVDRAGDRAGERGERDDHAQRDHGEDDAVLGHRLSILPPADRVEIGEEARHLVHLPSSEAVHPLKGANGGSASTTSGAVAGLSVVKEPTEARMNVVVTFLDIPVEGLSGVTAPPS